MKPAAHPRAQVFEGRDRRALRLAAYTLLVAAIASAGLRHLRPILKQPDADQYLSLAQGHRVMLPFASRQFGPLVVRAVAALAHVSYFHAFVIEGVLSLLVTVAVSTFLYLRADTRWWMLASVGGLSFWALQLNGLMTPDLFYSMLLCVFLLALAREQLLAAALMMLPLMLARESTLLTLLCFLLAGWRRLRRLEIVAAILAAIVGMLAVRYLARDALPNHEHIDPTFYLIAKLPWNLLKNVFGVGVWANLYPSCDVPRWSVGLHLGSLQAVGICGFSSARPLRLLTEALTLFGLLPLFLLRLGFTRIRQGSREMVVRFTLIYGAISFLLAPALGTIVMRLFGYSWPLFLVAVPLLLQAHRAAFRSVWAAAIFLSMHLFLSWSLLWMPARTLAFTAVIAYPLAWLLLRRELVLEPLGYDRANRTNTWESSAISSIPGV